MPAVSIFIFALGMISQVLAVLMVPFLVLKKVVEHIKKQHLS
jgi:hypothetical protein